MSFFSNSQGKPEKHRENKEKEWKNIEKSGKFLNPDIYIFFLLGKFAKSDCHVSKIMFLIKTSVHIYFCI